jgi:endonuclease/exonuclease/phosphatase family metal-dependent hydrolase
MAIRIVTWNIQKGVGIDLRRDLRRTASVLAGLRPAVIGLQEVVRTARLDQAAELARHLDMELAWGSARALPTGSYGNALLVRGRVIERQVHDLSVGSFEPRACLEALVDIGGRRLRVFVCHLGLRASERAQQVARLVDILRATSRGDASEPRVVMGDFNEWHGRTVGDALAAEFRYSPRLLPTHPSPWPVFALDRIAWDAPLRGDIQVAPVRGASDHRALTATVDVA